MKEEKRRKIMIGVFIFSLLIFALVFSGKLGLKEETKEVKSNVGFECGDVLYHQEKGYQTVKIDDQCWFAENLNSTQYNTGAKITKINDNLEWKEAKSPAYSCYNRDESNCEERGALYNFYAIESEDNLCPEGWKVPTDEEWIEMERNICSESSQVDCQEEFSNSKFGWRGDENLTSKLKEKGFNIMMGGFRNSRGPFSAADKSSFWWTASRIENKKDFAIGRIFNNSEEGIRKIKTSKDMGYSVRCIKKSE